MLQFFLEHIDTETGDVVTHEKLMHGLEVGFFAFFLFSKIVFSSHFWLFTTEKAPLCCKNVHFYPNNPA